MTRAEVSTRHGDTATVLQRFNEVFLSHDPAALAELVAPGCVIENTVPAPDGARCEGRDSCIALWAGIASNPGTFFEVEDVAVLGDRGIIRWRYCWGEGKENSVRGVNLMRVKDGQIVEALGYIKGSH